jgi:hypothetical protein
MKVVIPANVMIVNKILLGVAMFDILSSDWTTDYIFKYDDDKID